MTPCTKIMAGLTGLLLSFGAPELFAQAINPVAVKPLLSSQLVDLPKSTADTSAIRAMVDQGIMPPVSSDQFAPDAAPTAGQFAVAVQRMFNLPAPAKPVSLGGLNNTNPYYSAAEAATPFLGRQILCQGCQLGNNFQPDAPILPVATTISLVYILNSKHRLSLLTPAQAAAELAGVKDAGNYPPLAQIYLATALKHGVLSLSADHLIGDGGSATRADMAVRLSGIQSSFGIPAVASPSIPQNQQ
jgi:hypothetical protein